VFPCGKRDQGIGRVRPHKRSAANLKHLTRFLDVNREPERSEGGHSQKIVPGLEALADG